MISDARGAAFLLVACSGIVLAQDVPVTARPEFEVASIRANTNANPDGNIGVTPGGRVRVNNVSVRFIIKFAWYVQDFQIFGGPAWMSADEYDIDARGPEDLTLQRARPFLQTLLEDRFKLELHHEKREVPAYDLVPAKGGPRFAPTASGNCTVADPKNPPRPGEPSPHFCGSTSVERNRIGAYGVPMQGFAAALSRVVGRTVVDKSGVTGNVDIQIEFSPDEIAAAQPRESGVVVDWIKPSIFSALQEQLGLKLQASKAPGDLLVIDRLERPGEN